MLKDSLILSADMDRSRNEIVAAHKTHKFKQPVHDEYDE